MKRFIEVSPDLENAAIPLLQQYCITDSPFYFTRIYRPKLNQLKVTLALIEPTVRFHGKFTNLEQASILKSIKAVLYKRVILSED